MAYGYIYRFWNTTNNKSYIGQTTHPTQRLTAYRKLRCRAQTKLYNALTKYGFDVFNWRIIDEANSREELDSLEEDYIAAYDSIKSGYNISTRHYNRNAIENLSHRKTASTIQCQLWQDPTYRERQVKSNRNRFKDPITYKQIIEGNRTRAKDPNYRRKRARIATSLWQKPEYRAKHINVREEISPNIFRISPKTLWIHLNNGAIKYCSGARFAKLCKRFNGNMTKITEEYNNAVKDE